MKQDTVFAHIDELDRWIGRRRQTGAPSAPSAGIANATAPSAEATNS